MCLKDRPHTYLPLFSACSAATRLQAMIEWRRIVASNRDRAGHQTATALGFWWKFCVGWLAFCMAWEVCNQLWQIDLWVSRLWAEQTGFALRNHPWWGQRSYAAERVVAWTAMLALWVFALWPRQATGIGAAMLRAERWAMLLTVVLSLLLIQALKRRSATSCPWDLHMFGGLAPYVSHWTWGMLDGGPGRCFPAGHPSAALAYLAVPAFLGQHSPVWRRRALIIVLCMGCLLGLTQVMRGAHFVSHVLWTAWWCSVVSGVGLWVYQRLQRSTT